MTSRKTIITRQLFSASMAALISASAAATPFDPTQPVGPVMQGLVQAIDTATKSNRPLSAALVDTSQLNSTQAWSAAVNNKNQWIELPIPSGSKAIGIATQGRANAEQWVKRYKVSAVLPDGSLVPLHGQNALNGNANQHSIAAHSFNAPQQATAI